MGNSKKPSSAASQISSATAPAASSTTKITSTSSILRSLFCPSHFQLSLFASVIQGLDSQHLRIHDTATGRLRFPEYPIAPKATINCLDWGYYGENNRDRQHQESKKKRKRSEQVNGSRSDEPSENLVVAFGTSQSKIHMYSITEGKIIDVLEDEHSQGIRDFKFVDSGRTGNGWSIGGDGKAVQWNLHKGKSRRSLVLPKSTNTLYPIGSSLICASHTAYIIDPDSTKTPLSFAAFTNPVRSIVASSRDRETFSFLTAAEYDHSMSVFSSGSDQSIGSLRTENEVLSTTLYLEGRQAAGVIENGNTSDHILHPQEVLAVVNKDGILEFFPAPFSFGKSTNSKDPESLKSRRKQMTRKAEAQIRVLRPETSASIVPLIDAVFDNDDIVFAWVEGGVNPIFDRLKWRNQKNGALLFAGLRDIFKAKSGTGLGAVVMNGVKDLGKSYADESQAVIANGGETDELATTSGAREIIDISSGVEESDSDNEMLPEPIPSEEKPKDVDVEMEDAKSVDDDDETTGAGQQLQRIEEPEEPEEPSFGDIMRANAPEPVDVQAKFEDPNARALAPVGGGQLSLPSGMTLSTVLTQSLRTNDVNLLETCFHERNLNIVRATIERLDSSLAAPLIQKLAERLHSRPGRAGGMMVWIQWTAVAHGGYIAGQPEVMKKLAELRRVVDDRANSLQALLKLKGKLDMLEAQTNLRKSMQARSRMTNATEDDQEGIIYVEGQEESDTDDEDDLKPSNSVKSNGRLTEPEVNESMDQSESEDEDDGEDEMPVTMNGIIDDSEADSGESEEDLLDDEASSTGEDSDEASGDDEFGKDSDNSAESDVSSEPAEAPPVKRPKQERSTNGLSSSRW